MHYGLYYRIATPLIWLFIKLKLKPNTITIVSNLLRIVSLYFYLVFFKIPAVVLFQVGYILDFSDGMLLD